MSQPSSKLIDCPACGAKNLSIGRFCAACGKGLTVVIGPRPKVRHVGLGSVMIVIAVVAVCLAPIRLRWGLSVWMAIFFIPATIRAVIALERRRLDGRPAPIGQAIGLFVESFVIVFWIAMATLIAFVVTCFPIGLTTFNLHDPRHFPPGIVVAFVAGAISGLTALWFVAKRRWPDKD